MTREEAIKELKIFSGTTRIRLSANFWEALNTVIKALEQETCEDAVSRELKIGDEIYIRANVNEIRKDYIICENAGGYFGTVREEIKSSVTPTQKWIPVKERLPETDGDYLLFGKIDDFEDEYYKFIGEFDSAAEKFGICRDCFDPNTLGCLGSEFYEYGEVLAWMPLPEPYKPEKESKK